MRGTLRLLRAQLRQDRWQLLSWVAGTGLLVFGATVAVSQEFAEEAERRSIVTLAATNPAFLFLRGIPDGTGVGAVLFFQMFAFLGVLAGLMSTFLVVRHSRADEELGRTELVAGTRVGRSAPLVATLLLAVVAGGLLALAVAVGMLFAGLEAPGSLLTGAAVGAVGWVFAGIAAIAAQLLPTSRSANGVAASSVGLAYLIRGIGDALAVPSENLLTATSAWPSWLSPIGWAQRIGPFSDADPRPLLLSLGVAITLAVVAIRLRARRDLGASLLPERTGRARGGGLLRSSAGLAWTLHRHTLAGWAVGAAVLGGFAGGLAPTVAAALESNATLSELVRRLAPAARGDAVDLFTTAILGLAGMLAAASGVQAALRLRAEEAEGRAESLLATPVQRSAWVLSHLGVATLSVAVVALSAGLVAGVAFAVTGSTDRFGSSLAATFGHVPAALVFVGLAGMLFSVVPRLTVPLGWGLLALGIVLGQFGDLLRLPDGLQSVSPFAHSPGLPATDAEVVPLVVLCAVAAAAVAVAVVAFRRRDLYS